MADIMDDEIAGVWLDEDERLLCWKCFTRENLSQALIDILLLKDADRTGNQCFCDECQDAI